MKRYFKYIALPVLLLLLIVSSCSKEINSKTTENVSDLNIVNAIPASTGLIANFNNQLTTYYQQPTVSYKGFLLYRFTAGTNNFVLRESADTTKDLLSNSITFSGNTIYSYFLSGDISSPDSMLVQDQLPDFGSVKGGLDSSAGIRFVNLSKGSASISINIEGRRNGSEVQSLNYKGITEFKKYPADYSVPSYTFEFRDETTGNLLTSYTLSSVNDGLPNNLNINSVRFKNQTIVFCGDPGSESTFLVKNGIY